MSARTLLSLVRSLPRTTNLPEERESVMRQRTQSSVKECVAERNDLSVFLSLCSCERSKLLRARLSRQHNHVDVIDGRTIHISGCCMYVVNASSDT